MFLLSDIHFWTTREDVVVKHTDFGAFKYFLSQKDPNNDDSFSAAKRMYTEKRGLEWTPSNKRPFKTKDRLKELEDYLSQNKVVSSFWNVNELQILLSKGILVTVIINEYNISSISFNKSLASKIQNEPICDGIISGHQFACICNDGRIFYSNDFTKDEWIVDGGGKKRISLQDEFLCVWGRVNSEHPQPWAPVKEYQKANLLLYQIGLKGPELLTHKKTEGEPIEIVLSRIQSKTVISVEQKVSLRGTVSAEVNSFDVVLNDLKRTSVISMPLHTQVSCCSLSDNENHLMLGCIDGSIALLNRIRGSTQLIKVSLIPAYVAWHKDGAFVTIANKNGQLRCFDSALNSIGVQFKGEEGPSVGPIDLCSYLKQTHVTGMKWGLNEFFIVPEMGPLVMIRFLEKSMNFKSLCRRYLKAGNADKAIRLLLSWEWNEDCYIVLQEIVTNLLKLPLNINNNAQLLQDALSSFHSPYMPFDENIRHKYGYQVRTLTRRFFYQLVRYKMYDIAFLLAVDIGHHDLFMDLYYCAVGIGEKEMAAAARAKASVLLSECSSEASFCSRSSCSQCSDRYSESSEENVTVSEHKNVYPTSHQHDEHLLSTHFDEEDPKTSSKFELPKIRAPPLPITPPLPVMPHHLPNIPTLPLYSPPEVDIRTPAIPFSTSPLPLPNIPINLNIPPKKPQAKVKFSDTVTAFIVPEVKRPVRPLLPAHLTNPQKELADSLPLCHPNEDYLKDFTPIRRNEDEEKQKQPKIKVVHFGVV